MINVEARRCPCGKSVRFGHPGAKPEACADCKSGDMIMLGSGACLCRRAEASFGMSEDDKPSRCSKCKDDGMINLHGSRCQVCKERLALFGLEPGRPTCCGKCKDDGMVDVKGARCKSCGVMRVHQRTSYLCQACNPDSLWRHGTREGRVANFLKEAFPEVEWIRDRQIKDPASGCNKHRPDFLTFCHSGDAHWAVVVECDEDQHSDREKSCERARMVVILQELGVPTAFVRFNPDEWQPKLPKRLLEQPGQEERHALLQKAVTAALANPPSSMCTAHYLYYDTLHGQIVKVL